MFDGTNLKFALAVVSSEVKICYNFVMQNSELLLNLIEEYFKLKDGELIEKHLELMEVFKQNQQQILISRKALKHFVESRRNELSVNYSESQTIELLKFAVKNIENVFTGYDSTDIGEKNRKILSKDFSRLGLPHLRVVYDNKNTHLEIISIHFRKNRKN